jgi:citrate lyase beta subunit
MAKKRIHIFSFLMVILLFMLMFRLAQIQLISTESFSANNINLIEESVAQGHKHGCLMKVAAAL